MPLTSAPSEVCFADEICQLTSNINQTEMNVKHTLVRYGCCDSRELECEPSSSMLALVQGTRNTPGERTARLWSEHWLRSCIGRALAEPAADTQEPAA